MLQTAMWLFAAGLCFMCDWACAQLWFKHPRPYTFGRACVFLQLSVVLLLSRRTPFRLEQHRLIVAVKTVAVCAVMYHAAHIVQAQCHCFAAGQAAKAVLEYGWWWVCLGTLIMYLLRHLLLGVTTEMMGCVTVRWFDVLKSCAATCRTCT